MDACEDGITGNAVATEGSVDETFNPGMGAYMDPPPP